MLNDILNRRIEVDWKNGKKLQIKELTFKDWKEMIEIENRRSRERGRGES